MSDEFYQKFYKATITGISPLIMHFDDIEWADQLTAKRAQLKQTDKANSKAGDDRSPPDTWKGYLYRDESDDPLISMPQDNLKSCLMHAGKKVSFGSRGTLKALSQTAIQFTDMYYPLLVNGKPIKFNDAWNISGAFSEHSAAAKKLGFDLLVKRAKVGSSKHVRVRPKFRNWTVFAEFMVTDQQMTLALLNDLWSRAGMYVGLCDWRPGAKESPGPYGRFTVTITDLKR